MFHDVHLFSPFFCRGAELINRILIKAVLDEKEKEKSILRKIKKNMDRIKQQQAKMTERVVEPTDHYEGRTEERRGGRKGRGGRKVGAEEVTFLNTCFLTLVSFMSTPG